MIVGTMKLLLCTLLVAGVFSQIIHAAPIAEDQSMEEYEKEHPEEFGDFFEGDMEFEAGFRNAMLSPQRLWPNGIIYYEIDKNSGYTSTQIRGIESAMALFRKYTCVQWVKRTTQSGYVKIYKGSGCSATVGKSSWNGPQNLSLSSRCFRIGTIVHEMLHSAGFYHEQGRYDRDRHVTINYENIRDGKERNFRILPSTQIQLLGAPYDYGSVMHYGRRSFSKNGRDTITPRDSSKQIGQRTGFSKIDIEKVNKLYKCSNRG